MTVLRTFDPLLLMRLTTLENSHWSHTPKGAGPPDQEAKTRGEEASRPDDANRPTQQEYVFAVPPGGTESRRR